MKKLDWKWWIASIAGILASVSTIVVTFSTQVEEILEFLLDHVTALNVDRELNKAKVMDMIAESEKQPKNESIAEFDSVHKTRTGVVKYSADGRLEIVWLNPKAELYWHERGLKVGKRYHPDATVYRQIQDRRCVVKDKNNHLVLACAVLGNTHLIISFTGQEELDGERFRKELSDLAWEIDRFFLSKK